MLLGEKLQGAGVFASLKRANASAAPTVAQFTLLFILNQEQHSGEEGSRISLTNVAGLCRAVEELPARETIRRKKEMEREFNYPSAKTDTGPDAGPSPGQADVGREFYTDLVVWQGWETGS